MNNSQEIIWSIFREGTDVVDTSTNAPDGSYPLLHHNFKSKHKIVVKDGQVDINNVLQCVQDIPKEERWWGNSLERLDFDPITKTFRCDIEETSMDFNSAGPWGRK